MGRSTNACTMFTVLHKILLPINQPMNRLAICRVHLKCEGTRAETRFRLSAKWTGPFKLTGASVQSTTGSQSAIVMLDTPCSKVV